MPKEGVSFLGHEDILRYEEILRIVNIAVKFGIIKIRITGGEPLVRRGVIEFLSELMNVEGLQDISLTTNGILLEDFAERLFDAGIHRINVSLDSLVPEKYRMITRGGDLNRVLRGIEKARAAGFSPIKINIVGIQGFNDNEIENFAELIVDKPYQVRFIEYMPIGAPMNESFHHLSTDDIINTIKKRYTLLSRNSVERAGGPARVYRVDGCKGELGFIGAMSHQFCNTCNRLRLTANGELRACLFSDEPAADLKTPLREGCTDEELHEIITGLISRKPRSYEGPSYQSSRKKCVRNMSSIGG
jgi:cyclic pyranopterin phosphate synthase